MNDILLRALKTAAQAAIASVMLAGVPSSKDAAIAICASIVSAVWNGVVSPALNRYKTT